MLREDLRATLMEKIKTNPKEAIKILEEDPKILEILLNNSKEAESEKNEKIKYINMSQQMQNQLEEQAKKLKTTQGILIGAGLLFLLAMLGEGK